MHWRHKPAFNSAKVLLFVFSLSTLSIVCEGFRFRAQEDASQSPVEASAPYSQSSSTSVTQGGNEPSEWSVKNIVGLVGILLLIFFAIASVLYMGTWKSQSAKLRIFKVMLVDTEDEDSQETQEPAVSSELPLTAVIKVNSDHPIHHVVPLSLEETAETSSLSEACAFEIDQPRFESTKFSLIIREGNIPIHFETISGGKFVKAAQHKRLELRNVQENQVKLKGKMIVVAFDINR